MKIDITELLIFILTVLFAIITRYVVPWIRAKRELVEKELGETVTSEIEYWADIAIRAAEQRYKNKVGKYGHEKKLEVLKFLEDKGFTVDEEAIDNLIESLVFDMNAGKEADNVQ